MGRTTSVYCGKACLAKSGWQSGRLKGTGVTHDRRAYKLNKDFGLSRADYDAMLAAQGGVCAICGTDRNRGARDGMHFAVDHCHDTGKIRGLLCNRCNRALGFWEDDPALLRAALEYLDSPGVR